MNESVRIGTLEVRGDQRHQSLLLDSLEQQDWPAEEDRRVFFIRRIELQGPWWSLGQRAAACARDLVAAAVNGWSRAAKDADVVFFDSPADVTAYLCAVVVTGETPHETKSQSPWFQRACFQQANCVPDPPAATTVQQLLEEDIAALPDVLRILSRHRALVPVVRLLDTAAFDGLVQQVFYRHRMSLTAARTGRADGSFFRGSAPVPVLNRPAAQRQLLHWRPLIDSLAGDRRRAAAHFAAVIVTWRLAPQLLRSSSAPAALEFVQTVFHRLTDASPPSTQNEGDSYGVGRKSRGEPRRDSIPAHTPLEPGGTASPGRGVSVNDADDAPKAAEPNGEWPGSEHAIITHTGGFFFLLNVMEHTRIKDALASSVRSPWEWLFRLACLLHLELDESASRFIADRLALDAVGDLAAIPPLPNEADLDAIVDKRYAGHSFWARRDWAKVPARLLTTETHLDVWFHLNAARADVRLAGLDLDPGWLPWLGMVVNFHYIADTALLVPPGTEKGGL